MWKIFILVVLFLILGGMFVYQYLAMAPEDTTNVLQTGNNMIYVSDQRPGPSVLVDFVSMIEEGFVVIYENNDGNPGNIIGNSRILPKGESRGVLVGLVRPTVSGESFFAMLHEDNGDGFFSPNIDIHLRDQDGNIMYMIFYISEGSSQPVDFNL